MHRIKYKNSIENALICLKIKLFSIIKYIKLFSALLILSIIFYSAWHSKNTLTAAFYTTNFNLLLSTFFLLISINFILPAGSIMLLKSYSASLSYQNALKAHIHYLPARYLPGSIWQSVGKMVDYYSHGVALSHLTLFILLENFITVSGAFVLGGGCVGYFRGLHDSWGRAAALVVIIGLSSLIIVIYLVNGYVLKRLECKFYFSSFLKSVIIYTLACLLFAIAFSLYILSFSSTMNKIHPVEVGGTYLFSWAIGFVSVFTPQGFGITEFITDRLLTASVLNNGLAVLVAGFRIIRLISDMIVWIIYKGYLKSIKIQTKHPEKNIVINTDAKV